MWRYWSSQSSGYLCGVQDIQVNDLQSESLDLLFQCAIQILFSLRTLTF